MNAEEIQRLKTAVELGKKVIALNRSEFPSVDAVNGTGDALLSNGERWQLSHPLHMLDDFQILTDIP